MSTLPAYCDRTFEVEVELVPDSHLVFRRQRVDMPPGMDNVLFPRIAPDGTRFAGIGHRHDARGDGQCWEWDGAWHDRGPTHGIQSVIYDASGVLQIVRGPGEPAGSQGFRYIDETGRIVLAWETYDPTTPMARALGIDHLWEWTALGDVVIGQGGDEGGLQALVRGRRVLLADGDCRFIHAYRRGDVFALALVRNGAAMFPMFTLDELLAMPTYAVPGTTPFPPPPIPDPEEPPVSDIPEELRDQRDVIEATRPQPYEETWEMDAEWSKRAAVELKRRYPHLPIGVARAKSGSDNHGGATADVPEGFTGGIIALESGVHWDFKADGGKAQWSLVDNPVNYPPIAARFYPAEKLDAGVPTEPPKPPDTEDQPATSTTTALLLKIIALMEASAARDEALVSELAALRAAQGEQTATLKAAIAELNAQVKAGVKIRFS